jgi:hypothetical protein
MGECERCGRPTNKREPHEIAVANCPNPGGRRCRAAATAYQRGLRAGVELAKEHASLECQRDEQIAGWIEWALVDAALAEKLGGGG